MKKFLLTLATAAMVACAANAQKLTVDLSKANVPLTSALKRADGTLSGVNTLKGNLNVNRNQRVTRAGNTRNPYEISYETAACETYSVNIAALLNYTDLTDEGYNGYGFATSFTQDMLSRYVGSTITAIDFLAWDGVLTDGLAFILDGMTGRVLWSAEIESFQQLTASSQDVPMNQIACDYTVTGDEQLLYVGWVATAAQNESDAYKQYIVMPYYEDNTQSEQGAYFLYTTEDGDLGIYGNASQLQDNAGNVIYAAAYIVLETDNTNGLKSNDLSMKTVNPIRANLHWDAEKNQATASVRNMGINDVSSFDWTYTMGDKVQSGTYTLETAMPFYRDFDFTFDPVLADKPSREVATLTITNVNGSADEYTTDFDNEEDAPAVTMGYDTYARTPVIEEFTSTYCGWCPRGFIYLPDAAAACEDAVVIAVHSDYGNGTDPLATDSYADFLNIAASAFPSAMVNRLYTEDALEELATDALEMNERRVEASMKITTTTTGSGLLNKKINASTELTFGIDADADQYAVAYVITEDGITGVDQLNYYATYYALYSNYGYTDAQIQSGMGWTSAEMELAKLGTADASGAYWYQPTFDHVAVYNTDDLGLDEASALPAITNGQPLTHSTTIDFPTRTSPGITEANLSVAALLIDKVSGEIVTACQAKLGETSEASSIDQAKTTGNSPVITLQDGAFNVVADNATAQVYDLSGKLVTSATINGSASLPTFGKGVYTIRVVANGNVTTQKAAF